MDPICHPTSSLFFVLFPVSVFCSLSRDLSVFFVYGCYLNDIQVLCDMYGLLVKLVLAIQMSISPSVLIHASRVILERGWVWRSSDHFWGLRLPQKSPKIFGQSPALLSPFPLFFGFLVLKWHSNLCQECVTHYQGPTT